MDQCVAANQASTQFTQVTAVGTLGKVDVMPLKKRELVRVDLEVDDKAVGGKAETFGVEVHGELAERVAGMPPGSLVRVEGKLTTYQWKIKGNLQRERVTIVAESVDQLNRPDRRKKRV